MIMSYQHALLTSTDTSGQNAQSSTVTHDIDMIPVTFNRDKIAKICVSVSIHKSSISIVWVHRVYLH